MPEVPVLISKLNDYQQEGVNFISECYNRCINPLIGDQTGLGKTIQVMAAIVENNYENRPTLVICPPTVELVWHSESKHFTGLNIASIEEIIALGKDPYEYHFITARYDCIKYVSDMDCESNSLSYTVFNTQWFCTVLDEAHYLKGLDTQRSNIVKLSVCSSFRIAISATFYNNSLLDLYNVFTFLGYDSESNSISHHFPPLDKWKSRKSDDILDVFKFCKLVFNNLALCRTYDDVDIKLPPLKTVLVSTDFSLEKEMEIYDSVWNELLGNIGAETGQKDEGVNVLTLFQKLVKVCIWAPMVYPDEFSYEEKKNCAKILALHHIISKFIDTDEKFVIYSNHLPVLEFLALYLKQEFARNTITIQGSTTIRERKKNIDLFQSDAEETKGLVLLATPRTGGMGIELTAACKVIIMDRNLNPHIGQIQTCGRVVRRTQTRPCTVYIIETNDTIEKNIRMRCACRILIAKGLQDQTMSLDRILLSLDLVGRSILEEPLENASLEILNPDSYINSPLSTSKNVSSFVLKSVNMQETGILATKPTSHITLQDEPDIVDMARKNPCCITLNKDIFLQFHNAVWGIDRELPLEESDVQSKAIVLSKPLLNYIRKYYLQKFLISPILEPSNIDISKFNGEKIVSFLQKHPMSNDSQAVCLMLLSEYLNCCAREIDIIGQPLKDYVYKSRNALIAENGSEAFAWCDFSKMTQHYAIFALLQYKKDFNKDIFILSFFGTSIWVNVKDPETYSCVRLQIINYVLSRLKGFFKNYTGPNDTKPRVIIHIPSFIRFHFLGEITKDEWDRFTKFENYEIIVLIHK